MKEKFDSKEWAEDFNQFMNTTAVRPPVELQEKIFNIVRHDLNPGLWTILAKIAAVHAVVGSLSLSVCSQFGMGTGNAMMHIFMGYGATVCMLFCGALFLGLTTAIAGFLLSQSELRKIRKTAYAPVFLLGFLSLLIFAVFGANIVFEFALAWLVGAMASGILITEASVGIKRAIRAD